MKTINDINGTDGTDRTSRIDSYTRLIELLETSDARYRLLHHCAEGRTDRASALRGHRLEQAAKCLVVRVALGGRRRRYLLTVVPGDRWIDLDGIGGLYDAADVALAGPETAERLTGCLRGSIVPFSFDPDLPLLADPALLNHPEIYFNAACLDRSVALDTEDYVRLARPRLEAVARDR